MRVLVIVVIKKINQPTSLSPTFATTFFFKETRIKRSHTIFFKKNGKQFEIYIDLHKKE